MNALQKTLAIIAFLILASQTIRHAYLRWIEPRSSVLDAYDKPLQDEIKNAASLDELVRRYDPVRKQVEQAKQELSKAGKQLNYGEEMGLEPYKSEHALHEAIAEWEKKSKEIHEIRFFWLAGFAFFAAGLVAYRMRNRWFSLTLLIAAFAEFIYWTSPTFFGANTREFDRLLDNKLAFSIVSLALLIAVIRLNHIFTNEAEQVRL
ncbi:MAG TPA: hypothetical protein VH724_05105 [Candidatus Angelobacter sp.]|nr:hypothetical protein [Candidatus Angelobacter sp.]